jgi:hypothetical protein
MESIIRLIRKNPDNASTIAVITIIPASPCRKQLGKIKLHKDRIGIMDIRQKAIKSCGRNDRDPIKPFFAIGFDALYILLSTWCY